LLRTLARNTSDARSVPSVATFSSITTASRSSPGLSEVRSVESLSGSIGKISTPVYTDVVLCRAWRSIAVPSRTTASTSATATQIVAWPPGSSRATVS
jgi:hypothetical protein